MPFFHAMPMSTRNNNLRQSTGQLNLMTTQLGQLKMNNSNNARTTLSSAPGSQESGLGLKGMKANEQPTITEQ